MAVNLCLNVAQQALPWPFFVAIKNDYDHRIASIPFGVAWVGATRASDLSIEKKEVLRSLPS